MPPPAITSDSRFDWLVWHRTHGEERGGGVGRGLLHARGRNSGLYTVMGGSLAATRDIGGIPEKSAVILRSTRRRRGPWVLACTRPKTCDQHDIRHVNGSGT